MQGRGVRRLVGAHRADCPDSEAIVRLLARARFERVRSVVELVFTVSRLIQAPVLGVSCRGAEVVSYTTERMAPLLAMREPSRMDLAAVGAEDNDADLATVVAITDRSAAARSPVAPAPIRPTSACCSSARSCDVAAGSRRSS